jgi:hypothetical protein
LWVNVYVVFPITIVRGRVEEWKGSFYPTVPSSFSLFLEKKCFPQSIFSSLPPFLPSPFFYLLYFK